MSAPPVFSMTHSDRMAGSIPVWTPAGAAATPATETPNVPTPAAGSSESGFGFHDLLNIVNPLQHIPGVNALYRHFTGDTIKPVSQVLGDTLFGGVLGAAASFVNMLSTEATGHTIAGNLIAAVEGKPVGFTQPSSGQDTAQGAGTASDAATVLRYTDLGGGRRLVYEKVSAASDRMAGTMVRIREEDTASNAVPNVVVPIGQVPAGQPATLIHPADS